jgi:hypothetical protein
MPAGAASLGLKRHASIIARKSKYTRASVPHGAAALAVVCGACVMRAHAGSAPRERCGEYVTPLTR